MNKMNKQIKKEAIITAILYLVYFCWWYYFAYIFESGDVDSYSYVFGLPAWFFYSCVVGLVLINILVFLAVKFFFKDFDLDEIENKYINEVEDNEQR